MVTEDRESSNWSKERWKGEIDSRVSGMGLEKWRQNISTKSTLLLYRGKEKPKRELFYDGSWRIDQEDQGMTFVLGLGKDIPLTVIEETKLHLESIWNKRIRRLRN